MTGRSGSGSSTKMGSLGLHGGVRDPNREVKGPAPGIPGIRTLNSRGKTWQNMETLNDIINHDK